MVKEEQKKIDEENAEKWKIRKEKIRQEKIKAKEDFKKSLLNPNIKGNLLTWVDKNNNGNIYSGFLNNKIFKLNKKEKPCFEIRRGILVFSLKIVNQQIISEKTNFTSTELVNLQKKAITILRNNPDFLRKFKTIS